MAISNYGNMRRRNGTIEPIPLRQTVYGGKRRIIIYRLLMEHFKPKTEEDIAFGRNQVDHITHNPVDMNVNDIRNLRWCTNKENANFNEAKHNTSISMKGRTFSEETKRKMSESHKGTTPWNKDKKGYHIHSEESKNKISESLRRYNANKL